MLQIKVCSPGEPLLNTDQHTAIKGICSLRWGMMFRSPTSLTDFLPARSITGRGHLSISPFSYGYLFFQQFFWATILPVCSSPTASMHINVVVVAVVLYLTHHAHFHHPQREASFLLTIVPPAPHPSPLAPRNHLSTFFLCDISYEWNRIKHWFLRLAFWMFARSIPVVACIGSSFLFMAGWRLIVGQRTFCLFIHQFMDPWLHGSTCHYKYCCTGLWGDPGFHLGMKVPGQTAAVFNFEKSCLFSKVAVCSDVPTTDTRRFWLRHILASTCYQLAFGLSIWADVTNILLWVCALSVFASTLILCC